MAIATPLPSWHASATRLDAAARLILGDRELARDAVQEALIRAWRDLPGLRDPDRFEAWVHRLLVHASIDEVRRRQRRVIEVPGEPIEVRSPVDDFRTLDDRDALDRALGALRPEHRALVVLHYYLGMPLPEAASALGVSLGAAKSRLHRAIGSLTRLSNSPSLSWKRRKRPRSAALAYRPPAAVIGTSSGGSGYIRTCPTARSVLSRIVARSNVLRSMPSGFSSESRITSAKGFPSTRSRM